MNQRTTTMGEHRELPQVIRKHDRVFRRKCDAGAKSKALRTERDVHHH